MLVWLMPYKTFWSYKYTSEAHIFAFHCIDVNCTGITKNIHSYEICFTEKSRWDRTFSTAFKWRLPTNHSHQYKLDFSIERYWLSCCKNRTVIPSLWDKNMVIESGFHPGNIYQTLPKFIKVATSECNVNTIMKTLCYSARYFIEKKKILIKY